ncbi:hypothetical protein Ancab_010033 [Ancistrocladus abbreviatus]
MGSVRVRVNEEISGESLYFPGEDCRPDRGNHTVSGHGSFSSHTVAGDLEVPPGHKNGTIQVLSKNPVTGHLIGVEGAGGANSVVQCFTVESPNDDISARNPQLTDTGRESTHVAERRVEREKPIGVQGVVQINSAENRMQGPTDRQLQTGSIASTDPPRKLTLGGVFLEHGPVREEIGLAHLRGLSVFGNTNGGIECRDGGAPSKSQCMDRGALSKSQGGPGCSGNNVKPNIIYGKVPLSSSSIETPRGETGNTTSVCNRHHKSKLCKSGCRHTSMKLGVGPSQRPCGVIKKISKLKPSRIMNREVNSSEVSEKGSGGTQFFGLFWPFVACGAVVLTIVVAKFIFVLLGVCLLSLFCSSAGFGQLDGELSTAVLRFWGRRQDFLGFTGKSSPVDFGVSSLGAVVVREVSLTEVVVGGVWAGSPKTIRPRAKKSHHWTSLGRPPQDPAVCAALGVPGLGPQYK